jgi:DNA (cytosine-5)-methyltransferase 1
MLMVANAIDIFAGAGGLSIGLHMSGWNVEAAIEWDRDAASTYQRNFPGTHVICSDIRDVDLKQFQNIDLLAGGPPCQPFSVAGNQQAAEDSRDMLPQFVRVVKEVRPRAFLLENVKGLVSAQNLPYAQKIFQELISLGYSVHWKVLNSASYGVPQQRERVVCVGLPHGMLFKFPQPTHGPGTALPYVTVRQALLNVPVDEPNRAIISYAKKPILRPSPWAGLLINGQGRPLNMDAPSLTIPATAGGNRTHILDPDRILYEYHRYLMAGGKPRSGLVEGVRRLTVRESARLQSFPDEFAFTGNRSKQYMQIGNAVPPLLSQAISSAIYSALFAPEDLEPIIVIRQEELFVPALT